MDMVVRALAHLGIGAILIAWTEVTRGKGGTHEKRDQALVGRIRRDYADRSWAVSTGGHWFRWC